MKHTILPDDTWREHQNPYFAVMDTFEGPKIIEFCLFVNANIVCCKVSNRFTASRHFVWKSWYPPRRDDEIAFNVESTMYIYRYMAYTCMQSSSIWCCCLIITGCPISKNGPCFKRCVKFSCKEHARNDETKSNRKNKSKQNRVCLFRLATNASS